MSALRPDRIRLRTGDQLVLALVLVAASLAIHHTNEQRLLGACLGVVLVIASAQDLRRRKIPNWLTGPAALWGLVLGALMHPSGVPEQAFAGLAAGGFMFLFAVIYPKGLGMGDAKLALVMGIYLSDSVAVAMLVGLIVAALAGLAVIGDRGVAAGRKVKIPLGPFLAIGGAVAILVGPEIVHWYSQHESLSALWGHAMTSSGR
jgi:leader peptidase (prepilin peptidase)/N-methyltransferase